MQGIATLPYEVQEQPFIPTGGLETMKSAAEMLADFGRNGDTYIVHAAEGETMVPMEVLDENPRLKQMLFTQMEDMGIEPERYIVGSELNSINPITGQPEFFLKKIFRKISRGVKKVVKKIAPVVLPIALSFALGPIYGSALGSGITTLLRGGSLKDAAKSALISGAIGGISAGFAGPGDFMSNVKFAAGNPLQAGAYQTDKLFNTKGGIGGITYDNPYGFDPAASASQAASQASAADKVTDVPTGKVVGKDALGGDIVMPEGQNFGKTVLEQGADDIPEKSFIEKYIYDSKANVPLPDGASNVTNKASGEGYLESIFSPSRSSISQGGQALEAGASEVAKQNQILAGTGQPALSEKAASDLLMSTAKAAETTAPTFLTKAMPLGIAATTGVAGLAALNYKPGPDEDGDGAPDYYETPGGDLYRGDPEMFGFGKDFYGDNPYYADNKFLPPALFAAGGGSINGPGTPTSDSIPAMLSDGEFVMNAKAVRGAGNGDRRAGAKRMYDMMRSLERRA